MDTTTPGGRFTGGRSFIGRLFPLALSILPVALAVWTYRYVPFLYFRHDDFLYLYDVANCPFSEFARHQYAGHLYFARNAVYYILHALRGMDAQFFFSVVLATHAAAVWMLFRTVRNMTGIPLLAAGAALVWGIAPAHTEALNRYAFHGGVMQTAILFWILADMSRGAAQQEPLSWWRIAAWYAAALVGATCFGSGLAVALMLGPTAFFLLNRFGGHTRRAAILMTSLVVVPSLFALLSRFSVVPTGAAPTPSAMLWDSFGNVFSMSLWLSIGGANALLRPGHHNTGLSPWIAAIPFGIMAMLVLFALVRGDSRARGNLLAIGLLLACTYGAIGAGRAWIFKDLGASFAVAADQFRYHYLGMGLFCILGAVAIATAIRSGILPRVAVMASVGLWTIWLVSGGFRWPAVQYGVRHREEVRLVLSSVEAAVSAEKFGDTVYIRNRPFRSVYIVTPQQSVKVDARFPGWGAVFIMANPTNFVAGKRVFFVEDDEGIRQDLLSDPSHRSASLFVAPRAPF